jgi:rRNA maturation endonuclease Nob1
VGVKKKKMMKKVICSHCGKELKDEKEICPMCGGDAHAITMEINEATEIIQCGVSI